MYEEFTHKKKKKKRRRSHRTRRSAPSVSQRGGGGGVVLHVEYAEPSTPYGILFIVSLIYEHNNLEYEHDPM